MNFFSSASNCCVVKGVLGFRFGLCFLRLHLILAGSPFSATEKQQEDDHTTRSSSPSWPSTALTRGEGTLFRGLRTNRGETPPTATSVFLRDAAQFQRKAKLFRDRFIIFPRRRRKLGPHLALFCAPTARSTQRLLQRLYSLDISPYPSRRKVCIIAIIDTRFLE